MVKQLAHACVLTSNLAATRRFYEGVLGLPVQFEFVRQGRPYGYYFRCGADTFIEVFASGAKPGGGLDHLCFEVPDLDALIARLAAEGVPLTKPKTLGADHSWQCWCADPNGVRLEFQQYTAASLQRAGGICVVDW